MKGWGWLALLLGALLGTAWARRSQDLHCGACRALVDELEWEIAQVDPKKTIQMGSFRINPDGSQSVVENASCLVLAARHASASSTNLKDILADLIPKEQAKIKTF
ncbi:T0096256 isoform 2, partial [Pongo abelii]